LFIKSCFLSQAVEQLVDAVYQAIVVKMVYLADLAQPDILE
jgi:hypothetical protein